MPANLVSNRISLDIAAEDMQVIEGALQALLNKLKPHLVPISAGDRRTLPRMGAKTIDFVTKALGYAHSNPEFKPAFVDTDEFSRDLSAVGTLRTLAQPLRQLADLVDDSLVLSGSEAYAAALAFYNTVKAGAKLGLPGAQTIADDLAARFPGRPARAASRTTASGSQRVAGD
jgi:hypothetical protein